MMTLIKTFPLLLLFFAVALSGCNGSSSDSDSNATLHKIGVLLPLTGDLAGAGQTFKASVEVAAAKRPKTRLIVKDSQSLAVTSEAMMSEFKAEGVDMVIGPAGSEAALGAKNFADQNDQTLLSCSSTAVSLAIPNDSLFRFAVPDMAQAQVLAQKITDSGITHLAVFVQPDIYGHGLSSALADNFKNAGGTVFATYSMRGASSVEDMRYILDQFSQDLSPVLEEVGEARIGVVLVMYEQAVTLLQVADDYMGLHRLTWYGTDSLALSTVLTGNALASAFAVRSDFSCPLTAEFSNDEYQKIKDEISAVIGGPASVYAVMYHDALLVTFDAIEKAGGQSPEILRPALREVAAAFSGATGPIALDVNDDRSEPKTYNFWKVTVQGGGYAWALDSRERVR
ncbi:MAG: ABC transporter substrate-binding protein [Deltaproteobacteria bacterium]|nr:ABC transporter substrate-binding protein [Deltaproteobacteria bacterium]